MSLVIACPNCHTRMRCPEHMAGHRVRCTSCNQAFAVPELEPSSPRAGSTEGEDDPIIRSTIYSKHSKSYPHLAAGVLFFICSAVLVAAYFTPWWGIVLTRPHRPLGEPDNALSLIDAQTRIENAKRAFQILKDNQDFYAETLGGKALRQLGDSDEGKYVFRVWGWRTETALFGLIVGGFLPIVVVILWCVPLLRLWGWIASFAAAICGVVLCILALIWVFGTPFEGVAGLLSQGVIVGPYLILAGGLCLLVVGIIDGINGALHLARTLRRSKLAA